MDSPKMTRWESLVVGLGVGMLCPVLLFIFAWWITAALTIYHVIRISESVIPLTAFTGLATGIALDLLYLKRCVSRIYSFDLRLMALVYLSCSAIAVSTFMGLPPGNLALGTFAGAYLGRREFHTLKNRSSFSKTAHKAGLFTAIVTGAQALPIGLLALKEDWVIEWLGSVTGVDSWDLSGVWGIGLVLCLCVVLMAIQFWCTKTSAWIAFGPGRERDT